jgi:hypothetical protein
VGIAFGTRYDDLTVWFYRLRFYFNHDSTIPIVPKTDNPSATYLLSIT